MENSKLIAVYARQSVEKKDSISIEGQIELCKKECCNADNIEVFEDKGFSGKNTKRPAFERLMKDVESNSIDKIVCYRLDRISRSVADFGRIWEVLSEHNVEFVSVNEKFDTSTPIGRAMLNIIMVFAQLERETIAERIKDNYYQRIKKGAWPGGPAPYGYKIAEKRSDGRKVLESTEDAQNVKLIFELYDSPGSSLGKVARELNKRGVPCVKRKQWDTVSVYRVLRNPVCVKANADVLLYYKNRGLIIYNSPEEFIGKSSVLIIGKRISETRKYTDLSNHLLVLIGTDGIIDGSLFVNCQMRLDKNKQIKNTGKGKYTWLSGLIKCASCGYSLKVLNDKRYNKLYLVCSGRTNLGICKESHTEQISDIEAYVEAAIIKRIKSELHASSTEPKTSLIENELKISLLKVEDKISNLINSLAEAGPSTIKYINNEIERLDAERKCAEDKLFEESQKRKITRPSSINFQSLNFDGKKYFASTMIRKVLCSAGYVKIEWI